MGNELEVRNVYQALTNANSDFASQKTLYKVGGNEPLQGIEQQGLVNMANA